MKWIVRYTLLLIGMSMAIPAGALYQVDWNGGYTRVVNDADNICLSAAPTGDYIMAYADTGSETLESIFYDGTAEFHQVDTLSSIHWAKSGVTRCGSLPFIAYSDLMSDGVSLSFFHDGDWHHQLTQAEEFRVTGIRTACSGPGTFVVYTIQNAASESYIKLIHTDSGPYTTQTISKIASTNANSTFDCMVGPSDYLYMVWWNSDQEKLRMAVRDGSGSYAFSDIATGITNCYWVNLEFMTPNIPVVAYSQTYSYDPCTIKVLVNLGSGWTGEDVWAGNDLKAVDMCLDNQGGFVTPNWCFLLYAGNHYYCINRNFPSWNTTRLDEWSGVTAADEIKLEWNGEYNEVGAFINAPDDHRIWFYRGQIVTATPTPSTDPTATPTPPDPPTKTPTPALCDTLGVRIDMPATSFRPGDTFYCRVDACNPRDVTSSGVPLFVILDVYGDLFFAPSFGAFDRYTITLDPFSVTTTEVIPPFTWPALDHGYTNIWFYAAMTDPDITMLFGDMDSVMFEWSAY